MFTGIVEELGTVRRLTHHATGAQMEVQASLVLEDIQVGDSIALNGCCLTVVQVGSESYAVDAVEETLRVTTLGSLQPGDRVNLERSVRLNDRLGGHLVQGHIDAVGTLASREPLADGSVMLRFEAPPDVLRYVVYKGSIAVDGISLTVAALDSTSFSVAIIPHTQSVTTLGFRQPGDQVNLETDVLARYVERLLTAAP
jgi:riboflavin synthase